MTAAAARRERARRILARRRLLHFTTYTFPGYKADPVHALICEYLEAVSRGDLTRLIITAPPQHGKSELVSVRFPPWHLGCNPDDPMILTSYGADLAHHHSRQARAVVESQEYAALFGSLATYTIEQPVETEPSSRAVEAWQIKGRRGGLVAAGVGGPLGGKPAKIAIIDDPIKDWEAAQSETQRRKLVEWYRAVLRPRVWQGGAIILVMTRWHEEDLAGELLAAHPGAWTVLRLPALAETQEVRDRVNEAYHLPAGLSDPLGREPGEALAPGRYSAAALREIREEVRDKVFSAEYQGGPKPPAGDMFKRKWFTHFVSVAPAVVKERVIYWDLGHTEGGGNYTVGLVMSLGLDDMITVENVIRGQWGPRERDNMILQTAELYAVLEYLEDEEGQPTDEYVIVDPGPETWVEREPAGGKDVVGSIRRHLAGFVVRGDPPVGNKVLRAEPFAAYAEGGNVRLVRGPWNKPYVEELTGFPHGANDDQVDASSGAFKRLMKRKGRRKLTKGRTIEL